MDILSNIAELTDERLAEYATELRTAFDAIVAAEAPTEADVAQAEAYAEAIEAVATLQNERTSAAEALAARRAALSTRFHEEEEEETEPTPEPEPEPVPEPAEAAVVVPTPTSPPVAAASVATVADIAARTTRPPAPQVNRLNPVVITAAADVPEFATGSVLESMGHLGTAAINRMRAFPTPNGTGETEDLHMYGLAHFRIDFPDDLKIKRGDDDLEKMLYAGRESRLPGGSLTAAGGWCAPSETIYDLCAGATTEGILSVPEVGVTRGGMKFPVTPDFSTVYAAVGFCQTEAQAIAGTTKPCYEVPCPTFVDVRLDACGLCIKVPILTEVGYPEIIDYWMTQSMIAHQHKMNAKVIAAMVTAAGAAKVPTALGSTTSDTLGSLELIADVWRDRYRLALSATMEVVVPFWVKGAIRTDLANRAGVAPEVITDQTIAAHFVARNLSVQYVYDWQDLASNATAYPTTFQVLMYPAGTFVKGTADVINLSAVYDAASLAVNTYTGLFFEQGILVANPCYSAALITIAVCGAGRQGALNFTCA